MAMTVGFQFASWKFVEKNVILAFNGVEDHFLGCAPIGDGGDRTLQLPLCDYFVVVAFEKSHPSALWLGGLQAVTGGLRDSEYLVLAGA